jgi:hypothetical protein
MQSGQGRAQLSGTGMTMRERRSPPEVRQHSAAEVEAATANLRERMPCLPAERHAFPPYAELCLCGALRRPSVDVAEVTLFTPAEPGR